MQSIISFAIISVCENRIPEYLSMATWRERRFSWFDPSGRGTAGFPSSSNLEMLLTPRIILTFPKYPTRSNNFEAIRSAFTDCMASGREYSFLSSGYDGSTLAICKQPFLLISKILQKLPESGSYLTHSNASIEG